MSTLAKRLDVHFAALAAVGAVAGIGAAQKSDAAVVYSGTVNLNVPSTTAGIYLNVVSGVSAVTPGGAPGWDINPWGSTSLNFWANNGVGGGVVSGFAGGSSATLVDNLPLGTLVDASSPGYGTTNGAETTGPTAFLTNSSSNYIGFKFVGDDTLTHYGWARFSLSASTFSQPRTLVEYAYEDVANQGITVGSVPAPSAGMAVLALGGVGLLGRRRK